MTIEFLVRNWKEGEPPWEGRVTFSGTVDECWDRLAAAYPIPDGYYVVRTKQVGGIEPLVVFA